MPPRAQQRPPQSLTPQPNQGSPIAQLNPQQLAALQDHIRQTRQQTGQEVTPAMITEWMARNGFHQGAGAGQQQQQQQPPPQQQQMQQGQGQGQGNLDAVLHHLYPPHLANNPPAALAHLQSVLFPPQQGHKQSPFLQQVMLLAQNGRLSPEQMAQLKQAVAMKNGTQAQQQQQYQQQQHPQQMQQVPPQMQQPPRPAQGLPQQQQPGGTAQAPNEQNATQAVQQLRNRVHHIEALLARPDVNDEQRAKMQAELDNARTNLSRVVKMLLAAQAQQQAQQAQQQQQGGPAANNPAAAQAAAQAAAAAQAQAQAGNLNLANLQEAQRQAMERKIQAAQQAQQQAQQQANGQFRTASPAGFPGTPGGGAQAGLVPPGGGAAGLRQSPSMAGGALPAIGAGASPSGKLIPQLTPQQQAAAQAAQAAAAAGKKLTKKQQADAMALNQQQAAQQAQAQQEALARAQAMAQAQAVANQQKAAGMQPGQAGTPGGAQGQQQQFSGAAGLAAPGMGGISSTLSVQAPAPEAFQAPRPTISGGLANNPSIATPAITKPPTIGSDAFGGAGGAGGAGGKIEALPNKDNRPDDSKGRTVSKRKIRELVEAVDPEERLSDEVEDLLLEICDEFIDSVTRFGCQLAKHRKSDRLEVKDLALHLERSYNIRVPGFGPEEVRQSGARRVVLPPGHAARLAAIRESGRRR
ncbi:transcription initiation factor TFIID subunit 12 [Rhodotorula paludigena]|uniref:transcription initiation factor TFIID subunit 12 n=1 Tax=Rhodotorula paludigena TaxID=86838 RepID=UPI003172DCF1